MAPRVTNQHVAPSDAPAALMNVLAGLRLAQGITLAEMAQRMDTDVNSVMAAEAANDLHLSTAQRYARAVGVVLDITLAPDTEPQPEPPPCARKGCGRPMSDHDYGVFCP